MLILKNGPSIIFRKTINQLVKEETKETCDLVLWNSDSQNTDLTNGTNLKTRDMIFEKILFISLKDIYEFGLHRRISPRRFSNSRLKIVGVIFTSDTKFNSDF